jgi:colicin import membrane protein
MLPRLTAASLVLALLLVGSAKAQWQAPADKKFTETRLRIFLEAQKDWLDESAEILRQATAAQTPEAKLAAVSGIDKRYQACLDRHHVSQVEYEWLAQRAAEAWAAVTYLDGELKTAQDRLDAQARKLDAAEAAQRSRLAMYQQAKVYGWRVLSAEDRDAAVKAARAEQQAAADEARQRADDAAADEAEAKQHDADAKNADDQAANPPADVSVDDRSEYVQNKKNEARAARDSAKEVRIEEADAKKAEAEAQARAEAAGLRAEHPEIPITDDDKAAAKSDNDAGIAAATKSITALQMEKSQLAQSQKNLMQTAKAMTKDVPAENIAIMRKYADQYREQSALARQVSVTTQPAR